MFTKTMIALCSAVVLATAFSSAATARNNTQEWWRDYGVANKNGQFAPKRCIRGEESETSASPSWMVC